MNPAFSVIFFTTASGAGYGLLALLGAGSMFALLPLPKTLTITGVFVALCLITGGLLSSTFHLGHPERAWRALSQWRTSWLSREGVCAIVCYVPALTLVYGWIFSEPNSVLVTATGLACVLLALLTVFTTSMIYASLRSIHAWSNHWVPINYLLFSLTTGGLLLSAFFAWFEVTYPPLFIATIALFAASFTTKLCYWRFIDTDRSASTAASAIGVEENSGVKLTQAPHTETNYLQQEMVFQIARKHAQKLRRIALLAAFVVPPILLAATLIGHSSVSIACCTIAVLVGGTGIVVERWLFFAEARHTVGLYYGAEHA